jgi:hypothetical protein
VRFDGGDEFNPLLDIRTERVIRAVTARVDVRGTLKQPEISLTSTPPLDEADILSLIIFNQPVNSLGEGQQISLAQSAQSLATGAAVGALAQSIGSALNVDMFEIEIAPDSGSAASLTIGQQVGQNLYVKVRRGSATRPDDDRQYEINKWLRLRTNVFRARARSRTCSSGPRAAASISCSFSAIRQRHHLTRASLKHAPPPRSVSVSGTSAVPVVLLRVLRRHSPLGRLTVPRRIDGTTESGQCTSPRSLNIRTKSPSANPRSCASSGCIRSLTSGRGNSPSVELIVRSLDGEISASG